MDESALTMLLARNLQAVLARDTPPGEAEPISAKRWAEARRLDPKMVQRALKPSNSPTLDTVQKLADAADLAPWQLLFPALDPKNPPVFAMSKAERDLYARIKGDVRALPDV